MSDEMTNSELRDAFARVSKDNTSLLKDVQDLNQKIRIGEAQNAFREAGFVPANGSLYAAINPEGEITAEAVTAFATEQGLVPAVGKPDESDDSGDSASKADDGTTVLAPLAGSGSRAGEGGAGGAATDSLTISEWQDLYALDPAAAKVAVASGKVEISKDNVFVKGTSLPRGVNPYALASDPS